MTPLSHHFYRALFDIRPTSTDDIQRDEPQLVWETIFSHLSSSTLLTVRVSCKHFRSLIDGSPPLQASLLHHWCNARLFINLQKMNRIHDPLKSIQGRILLLGYYRETGQKGRLIETIKETISLGENCIYSPYLEFFLGEFHKYLPRLKVGKVIEICKEITIYPVSINFFLQTAKKWQDFSPEETLTAYRVVKFYARAQENSTLECLVYAKMSLLDTEKKEHYRAKALDQCRFLTSENTKSRILQVVAKSFARQQQLNKGIDLIARIKISAGQALGLIKMARECKKAYPEQARAMLELARCFTNVQSDHPKKIHLQHRILKSYQMIEQLPSHHLLNELIETIHKVYEVEIERYGLSYSQNADENLRNHFFFDSCVDFASGSAYGKCFKEVVSNYFIPDLEITKARILHQYATSSHTNNREFHSQIQSKLIIQAAAIDPIFCRSLLHSWQNEDECNQSESTCAEFALIQAVHSDVGTLTELNNSTPNL